MADYAKRPEITVSTMGKVHNPTGEGVALKSNTIKQQQPIKHHTKDSEQYETKVKEEGTSRRNITRKKSDEKSTGNYDSKHKKQGGSGKSKWSDDMIVTDDDVVQVLNSNDPLYDDDEKDGEQYVLSTSSNHSSNQKNGGDGPTAYVEGTPGGKARPVYGPMLTSSEFKIQVTESLREYFQSSDTSEFLRSLEELRCAEYHSEVIKRAVHLACDAGPRERELTSRLLTELHPLLLNDEDIAIGFENVLESMDDMVIDIPDANTLVGSFLARAVVDEVLPPAFLSNKECKENSCVEHAVRLLSREHCTARLEKVWGPGDGRPVEELKTSMDQLLKEYLLSRELDEAARCVRELQVPHFHHELIKRGIKIAMEEDGANANHNAGAEEDASVDAMAALFLFLIDNSILSENQLKKGLIKVKDSLDDIALDVPDAPQILKEFEDLLSKDE